MRINLKDIFEMPTAEIFNPDDFRSASHVTIDSRKTRKNSIFVAIKGERFDGHDFVRQAVENGASTVVVERRKLRRYDDLDAVIVTVKNTLEAYGYLAKVWRNKLSSTVISVTGSNGKTTTKEMLATLLSEKFVVTKSEGNNNNQIGVPLSIFSANNKTEILILEHGTNHFGEIAYTAAIASPDYALITNIGESHTEFLKDKSGVLKEKLALWKATAERNVTIFVNNDDELLRKASTEFERKITYGFKGKPDFKGKIVGYDKLARPEIQITYKNRILNVRLPLPGNANAKNFLAAASVALTLGLGKREIAKATQKLKSVRGRIEINDFGKAVLIDDTYNSNPVSVKAATEVLRRVKVFPEKLLILGDMFELGKQSAEMHRSLNTEILRLKNFKVLTLGRNMKKLADALGNKAIHFSSREKLKYFLLTEKLDGKVILVKGSRGMKMEEFVDLIKQRFAE